MHKYCQWLHAYTHTGAVPATDEQSGSLNIYDIHYNLCLAIEKKAAGVDHCQISCHFLTPQPNIKSREKYHYTWKLSLVKIFTESLIMYICSWNSKRTTTLLKLKVDWIK